MARLAGMVGVIGGPLGKGVQKGVHMKRFVTMLTATLFALAMMVGSAAAHSQDWDDVEDPPFDPHPHVLLIGVDATTLTFERCVDLAGGQTLPMANQHNQVHQGTAGEALVLNGEKTSVVAPYTCGTLPLPG